MMEVLRTEPQWEWWDQKAVPKTNALTECQRCGVRASKVAGLTRHHEKRDGKRTGRVTKLCRKCHAVIHHMEPKFISNDARNRAFDHVSSCEDCADKMLRIIDHSRDKNNDCGGLE